MTIGAFAVGIGADMTEFDAAVGSIDKRVAPATKGVAKEFKSVIPAVSQLSNAIGLVPGPIGNIGFAARGALSVFTGPGGWITAVAVITSLAIAFKDDLLPNTKKVREELDKTTAAWNGILIASNRTTAKQKLNLAEGTLAVLESQRVVLDNALKAEEIVRKRLENLAHLGVLIGAGPLAFIFPKAAEDASKFFAGLVVDTKEETKAIEELNLKIGEQVNVVEGLKKNRLDEAMTRWGESTGWVAELNEEMQALDQEMKQLNIDMLQLGQTAGATDLGLFDDEEIERARKYTEVVGVITDAIGVGMSAAFEGTEGAGKEFLKSLALGFIDMVQAMLIAAKAAAFAKSVLSFGATLLQDLPTLLGATILLQGARAAISSLAEGGVAFGPHLAIVGDNPNAARDPEVIAPLSKLEGMMGGGMGRRIDVFVHGEVSGNVIKLVQDQVLYEEGRTT